MILADRLFLRTQVLQINRACILTDPDPSHKSDMQLFECIDIRVGTFANHELCIAFFALDSTSIVQLLNAMHFVHVINP